MKVLRKNDDCNKINTREELLELLKNQQCLRDINFSKNLYIIKKKSE